MFFHNGNYYKLNEFANWRVYLNAIVSFSSFVSNLYLSHQYVSAGSYEIAVTFTSTMSVFRHTITVNQCNLI